MASSRKSLLNPMMKHRARLADTPMRELFAKDKARFKTFTASAGDTFSMPPPPNLRSLLGSVWRSYMPRISARILSGS